MLDFVSEEAIWVILRGFLGGLKKSLHKGGLPGRFLEFLGIIQEYSTSFQPLGEYLGSIDWDGNRFVCLKNCHTFDSI